MRKASPALIAFLQSNQQFFMTDLYTFTLVGGFVARYTSYDIDLSYGGNTYWSFRIGSGQTRLTVGVEVDTLDVAVYPGPADLLNGTPWLVAANRGALDGARVKVERLFMPTPGDTSLGTMIRFEGRVGEASCGRTEVRIPLKSDLELLDMELPRNSFQSGCLNTLFDNACGLNKAGFAYARSVQTCSTSQLISFSNDPDQFFTLGTIRFTSGINSGVTRTVRNHSGGLFQFAVPLVTPAAPGDTFYAYPGCDKTMGTCRAKFGNVVNFKGHPYIPDPEVAT